MKKKDFIDIDPLEETLTIFLCWAQYVTAVTSLEISIDGFKTFLRE